MTPLICKNYKDPLCYHVIKPLTKRMILFVFSIGFILVTDDLDVTPSRLKS